jgi:hypothetical protein
MAENPLARHDMIRNMISAGSKDVSVLRFGIEA